MGLITLVNIAGSPKEPRTLNLPAAWEQSTCFCQTAGECSGSVLKRDEILRSVTPFIHRGRVWVHLSQLETGRPHKGTRKGRVTRASGLMMTLPYFLRALLHHRALLFLPFCVWEGFEKSPFFKGHWTFRLSGCLSFYDTIWEDNSYPALDCPGHQREHAGLHWSQLWPSLAIFKKLC